MLSKSLPLTHDSLIPSLIILPGVRTAGPALYALKGAFASKLAATHSTGQAGVLAVGGREH